MPRQDASAALSVERFFQFSLLGLVASGYLAVAGSGYLDAPTIALTTAGLLLRAMLICGILRLEISDRITTIVTVLYAGFFAADYLFLSRDFSGGYRAPAVLPGGDEDPHRAAAIAIIFIPPSSRFSNCLPPPSSPSISISSCS